MKHKKDAMIKKFEEAAKDHHRKNGKVFKSDRKLFKKAKKIERSNEKAEGKISKVMREYKEGSLHSGSKKGPQVKNRKQAIAIALSEARRGKKK